MVHTYEVLVDIKEETEPTTDIFHSETLRYEIDALSKQQADRMARTQAKSQHPLGFEYDVRVTRLLK